MQFCRPKTLPLGSLIWEMQYFLNNCKEPTLLGLPALSVGAGVRVGRLRLHAAGADSLQVVKVGLNRSRKLKLDFLTRAERSHIVSYGHNFRPNILTFLTTVTWKWVNVRACPNP